MTVAVHNQDGPDITLEASADLSAEQFTIMTLNTSGLVKQGDDADEPVEALIGILQNKPDAANEPAVVRIAGLSKVVGGGAVAPGIWITCDSTGEAVASVANDNSIGITVTTLADGAVGLIIIAQTDGHVVPA